MNQGRRVAIIVNPTKVDDLAKLRGQLTPLAAQNGFAAPEFIETTEHDPGRGQTEQAVADGFDLVCSLGGDGTVRAVAEVLAGGDIPLGLLPGGTGNLLARNLGLPVDDLDACFEIALTGTPRRIDVGQVEVDEAPAQAFLVMVGMGLDAETMAGADERVKKVLSWVAYLGSGLVALFKRGFSLSLRVHTGTSTQTRRAQHARTVLVGNCGYLQGGIALLPDAEIDDGRLDSLVLAPRGLFGWAAAIVDIATRHRRGHARLRRAEAEAFEVRTKHPVQTQIDGDPIGEHTRLRCTVQPSALLVCAPVGQGDR